ncbi:MAG: hypothetical protein ACTHM4_13465, partial [Rhodanobacteraceae bacterium]
MPKVYDSLVARNGPPIAQEWRVGDSRILPAHSASPSQRAFCAITVLPSDAAANVGPLPAAPDQPNVPTLWLGAERSEAQRQHCVAQLPPVQRS